MALLGIFHDDKNIYFFFSVLFFKDFDCQDIRGPQDNCAEVAEDLGQSASSVMERWCSLPCLLHKVKAWGRRDERERIRETKRGGEGEKKAKGREVRGSVAELVLQGGGNLIRQKEEKGRACRQFKDRLMKWGDSRCLGFRNPATLCGSACVCLYLKGLYTEAAIEGRYLSFSLCASCPREENKHLDSKRSQLNISAWGTINVEVGF